MIEQLESELREVFAARAAEVPAGAGARLRRVDYRPRARTWRPPVALGALAAAAAAAVVISIVGLGAGTPEAFAGWTPAPTAATASQIADAKLSCRQQLSGLPAGSPAGAGAMSPVLTDTRGPFTFVIFAGAHGSAACISGPSFTSLSGSASSGSPDVPAGQVVLSASHVTARAGHAYSFAEGHTGAGVTATTLTLDDGTRVQASSANGWFVAWWPGTQSVTSAELTTAAGTTTQRFDTPAARPCPAPAGAGHAGFCTSGSISGAGGGGANQSVAGVVRSGQQ
jgi:hypothetical protein